MPHPGRTRPFTVTPRAISERKYAIYTQILAVEVEFLPANARWPLMTADRKPRIGRQTDRKRPSDAFNFVVAVAVDDEDASPHRSLLATVGRSWRSLGN